MSPAPNQLRRGPPRPNPKAAKPGPNPCQPNPRLIPPPRYVVSILRYDTLPRYNGRCIASRCFWQHRDSKATPRAPPAPGRPQRALIISDPANLARLDQIRADVAELTDPRKTTAARAAEIAAKDPAIVLFQYTVHGDEPAGFEAAMQVAYQMLASDEPATLDVLKNVVLVLNPSANPDGHERFAAWYNSVAGAADQPTGFDRTDPSTIPGRYN